MTQFSTFGPPKGFPLLIPKMDCIALASFTHTRRHLLGHDVAALNGLQCAPIHATKLAKFLQKFKENNAAPHGAKAARSLLPYELRRPSEIDRRPSPPRHRSGHGSGRGAPRRHRGRS